MNRKFRNKQQAMDYLFFEVNKEIQFIANVLFHKKGAAKRLKALAKLVYAGNIITCPEYSMPHEGLRLGYSGEILSVDKLLGLE